MKSSALQFLVCPSCKGSLLLSANVQQGSEILEGALSCRPCRAVYPILRGVPRFIETSPYAVSFGYQWNWFRTVQIDSLNGSDESARTLEETTGWKGGDYKGRLVLDVGVGAGRFAEIVAKHGGEVIGIDVTTAVDAAFSNIGRNERVHVIQADLFAMPFPDETFDLAYAIGVLHHTPDPRAAFDRVAGVVKKRGEFAVYMYAGYGSAHRFSDLLRTITTRLPLRLMFILSGIAVPLYYVHRVPFLGHGTRVLLPISMHPNWRWRWLDTFDWYTPRYQWKVFYPEVYRWFRDRGFVDIEIFDDPIRMRGTAG